MTHFIEQAEIVVRCNLCHTNFFVMQDTTSGFTETTCPRCQTNLVITCTVHERTTTITLKGGRFNGKSLNLPYPPPPTIRHVSFIIPTPKWELRNPDEPPSYTEVCKITYECYSQDPYDPKIYYHTHTER